jgi:hypothetical protein
MTILLASIASVSLIVGGIGIMNIMELHHARLRHRADSGDRPAARCGRQGT